MRLAVLAIAALLTLAVACGGGTGADHDGRSGNAEGINQNIFRLLRDGEFIDTKPIRGSSGAWISVRGGLHGIVSRADAIVVAEITEVVDLFIPTRPAPPNWPVAQIEDRPLTTYSASVERWVKGSGEDEVLITGFGGVAASGPDFLDGDFLLQPGRRYVLALYDKREGLPGPGQYERAGLGFGAFEVTDGFVHVLNNPMTQELQKEYGGMPLDDFVALVNSYVATPYISPTPAPPTPEPYSGGQGGQGEVSVDVDPTMVSTNTSTNCSVQDTASLGTLSAPAIVSIEFCVRDIPSSLAMAAFQVRFSYDPAVLRLLSNTVSDPAGTSYFLEKCSGGGDPLAVFALDAPGDAVIGGSAIGPVSAACSTSIFSPGGRLATVDFLCVGSGTNTNSVINLQPGADSFYADTSHVNHEFATLTAGTITSVTCPEPPQAFSVTPLGNSACDPADILVAASGVIGSGPCSPFGVGPDILIRGGANGLGLVTGCAVNITGVGDIAGDGPPNCDDVDALSFGNDISDATTQRIFFSVGPGAKGCGGSPLNNHAAAHRETDEFDSMLDPASGSCTGTNTVFATAAALFLSEGDGTGLCALGTGVCPPFSQNDDLDALAFLSPFDFPVYYSLAPNSPTLTTVSASPADILMTAEAGGNPAVAVSAFGLGLATTDDIDALCLFRAPESGAPVLFSLAAGSPTLSSISASEADILLSFVDGAGPSVFKDGGDYGIRSKTIGEGSSDDLDALKCEETSPLGD